MKRFKITYKYDYSPNWESKVVKAETKGKATFDFRSKNSRAKILGVKEAK